MKTPNTHKKNATNTPVAPQTAIHTHNPGKAGSAIVGVLVALVFIGIVTTAMLKSTASQSTASRGQSGVQTMHITAKSGLIATKSYFTGYNNAAKGLEKLNSYENNQTNTFVHGSNYNKVEIAKGQTFNSRLANLNTDKWTARFEIKGGKTKTGADLKNAQVFAKLENLKKTDDGPPGDGQAFFSEGPLNVMQELVLVGNATFKDKIEFARPASFNGSVYFGKEVTTPGGSATTFDGEVYFGGGVTAQSPIIVRPDSIYDDKGNRVWAAGDAYFNSFLNANVGSVGRFSRFGGKTYIGGDVWLSNDGTSNTDTLFKGSTSIQGNLSVGQNSPVNFTGEFRLGGNITQAGQNSNQRLTSLGATRNFYYDPAKLIASNFSNHLQGFTLNDNPEEATIDILASFKARALEKLDPTTTPGGIIFHIDRIPASVGISGNTIMTGSNFDVEKLRAQYANPSNANNFYGKHLVVRVSNTILFNTAPAGTVSENVIYIVESGGNMQGDGFYDGSSSGSTLVYVKPGGSLSLFGSCGLYRGFFCIDKASVTSEWGSHSIATRATNNNAGRKTEIHGGIYNYSPNSKIEWHDRATGGTAITFSKKVLCLFKSLYCECGQASCYNATNPCTAGCEDGSSGGTGQIVLEDDSPGAGGIGIVPFGYYFQ